MSAQKKRADGAKKAPTIAESVARNNPDASADEPLLVLSSDAGFGKRVREMIEEFETETIVLPLAGFVPGEFGRKNFAAVVDCRKYFGVAQQVLRNLHESHPELPILAIVANEDKKKEQRDLLYGAGANMCISEKLGDEILVESLHALFRMGYTLRQAHALDRKLGSRSSELASLRKEVDTSQSQLAKRVQEQITVYRASGALLRVFDFDDLANEIVRLATIELGAEVGSLMIIEGDELVVRALCGHIPGEDPIMGRRQKIGEGISGWVAREGKPLLITDIDHNEQFRERGGVRYKTKSCVSCPIIARGRIRGIINITNKKSGPNFNEDDLRLLRTLTMTAAVALDNSELVEQMKRSETMSSVGELAARMAHEIRNPLHAIKMTIQILGKKFPMDEDSKEYYDILLGEINRLENLVKEVLSFVRQEKLNPNDCDINGLIEHTLVVLKSLLDERKIKTVFEAFPDLPAATVDEDKIEQALMNLVVNAVEAMPEGGELKITTGIITPFLYPKSQYGEEIADVPRDQSRYAVIAVKDGGVGIDHKFFDRIFHPFFTTKIDGTGLGLSTTRKIIEAHGGKILFESNPGKGTTFRIELPLPENENEGDAQ